MFNLSREIPEQALSRREPVRRFNPFSMLKKIDFKGQLKSLALMTLIGGAANEAGTAMYHAFSKPAAEVVESSGKAVTDTAAPVTTDLKDSTTTVSTGEPPTTPPTTSGSESLTNAPTNGKPPTTPPTTSGSESLTNAPTNGKPPGTAPTTGQSDASYNAAMSSIEWKKRALGHGLPVDLFGKPYLNRFFRRRCSWCHHYHWPSKPDPFRVAIT
jgi:hypothetical protein